MTDQQTYLPTDGHEGSKRSCTPNNKGEKNNILMHKNLRFTEQKEGRGQLNNCSQNETHHCETFSTGCNKFNQRSIGGAQIHARFALSH